MENERSQCFHNDRSVPKTGARHFLLLLLHHAVHFALLTCTHETRSLIVGLWCRQAFCSVHADKLGSFFPAPFPMQSTTSAMASPERTIPCVHVDLSMHLRSLFDVRDIQQDAKPHDWSSLFKEAIKDEDLRPLVVSVGLLLDSHVVSKHPTKHARWTEECGCPACTQLHLVFKRLKPQTRTAAAVPATNCFLLESQESGRQSLVRLKKIKMISCPQLSARSTSVSCVVRAKKVQPNFQKCVHQCNVCRDFTGARSSISWNSGLFFFYKKKQER
jgi:hypothetical protein